MSSQNHATKKNIARTVQQEISISEALLQEEHCNPHLTATELRRVPSVIAIPLPAFDLDQRMSA
jgi:hypothetical protein